MFSGRSLFKATVIGIALIVLALLAMNYVAQHYPSSYDSVKGFVEAYGFAGVFVLVFLGSSLLPFPTDLIYSVIVKLMADKVLLVVAVAVFAAFVASIINYYLAFALRKNFVERFVDAKQLRETEEVFDKYGPIPIVLFGVVPASPVFDPLTFVAGLTRMDLKKFAFYSLVSRVLHFGILAGVALQFF